MYISNSIKFNFYLCRINKKYNLVSAYPIFLQKVFFVYICDVYYASSAIYQLYYVGT